MDILVIVFFLPLGNDNNNNNNNNKVIIIIISCHLFLLAMKKYAIAASGGSGTACINIFTRLNQSSKKFSFGMILPLNEVNRTPGGSGLE